MFEAHSKNTEQMPALWAHQRKAIESAHDKFALFFDPGCGKTRTAIEILVKKNQYRAIIFAPLNVCRNWIHELLQYYPYDFKTWLVSGQTKLKKLKIIGDFAANKEPHAFLICNIEALRSRDYLAALARTGVRCLILDESHNFKSPTSKQTKALFELCGHLTITHLLLLTGTPAPQGEIDLWSTFRLLGVTNDIFFLWRRRHFADKNESRRGAYNYWPEYVVTKESREQFQRQLLGCSVVARKDKVLDLPPLLRTTLYTELSKEQKIHYKTMEEYLFAVDKDGNELNASNLLSRTLRLQQIIAGLLGDVAMKDNPRLDVLREAIQLTAGEQFIVWTIFAATYTQIGGVLEELGISFGRLTGEQTPEVRAEAMAAFQSGKLRALIAHPKAGGVGVNLTAASYSIHYTKSFSLVDDLQAEARNYRGGSEIHKRITRIDVVAQDTIDEDITEALRAKKSLQDFILGLKEKYGRK